MVHYKVGDYIRIKKREGDAEDYPFSFVGGMAKLAGGKYEIATIEEARIIDKDRKYYNGDDHSYYLKKIGGDCISFTWHSSMFEPYIPDISESKYKVGDTVIIASKEGNETDYPFHFILDMRKRAGEIYIIDEVKPVEENSIKNKPKYNGDSFEYTLKYPGGKIIPGRWHSSMFEDKTTTGDSVIVVGNKGTIIEHDTRHTFYVAFDFDTHVDICEEIKEIDNFEELAKKFNAAVKGFFFPEFKTIEDLLGFIKELNSLYKGKKEDKQTIKTSQNHEIGLQKSKASLDGGSIRRRGTISFERCKARIV